MAIGDAESFATWNSLFASLRNRGLYGVDFVASDDRAGLVEAARKNFAGATCQRCQVHLMRNILGHCSSCIRGDVANSLKSIFNAMTRAEAQQRRPETLERFGKAAKNALACLEAGFEDALAVIDLPEKYRKRLRSNNMLERLNQEVRRRERVIRVFPNDASALRMSALYSPRLRKIGKNEFILQWMSIANGGKAERRLFPYSTTRRASAKRLFHPNRIYSRLGT